MNCEGKSLQDKEVKDELLKRFNQIATEEKFNTLEKFRDLIFVNDDWE